MDWNILIRSQPDLARISTLLRAVAEHRRVEAGQPLFRAGDRPEGIYCVISGEVRLIRRTKNGAEIVLQRSRGGFIAEASLWAKAYHCDAIIAEVGEVLRFPKQDFLAELDANVRFRDAWMVVLAHELRKLRARCERLSLNTAAERIIHCIQSDGEDGVLTLTQSRKAWAAELGLTHEALYRALRRLTTAGVLSIEGDRIVIS